MFALPTACQTTKSMDFSTINSTDCLPFRNFAESSLGNGCTLALGRVISVKWLLKSEGSGGMGPTHSSRTSYYFGRSKQDGLYIPFSSRAALLLSVMPNSGWALKWHMGGSWDPGVWSPRLDFDTFPWYLRKRASSPSLVARISLMWHLEYYLPLF